MFHKSTGNGAETWKGLTNRQQIVIIATYLATSIKIHHDKPNLVANQEKRPPEALMVVSTTALSSPEEPSSHVLDQCGAVFEFLESENWPKRKTCRDARHLFFMCSAPINPL